MNARRSTTLVRALSLGALAAALSTAGCVADPGATSESSPLTQCPGPNTLLGVDVSEYQRSINWGAVAGAGVAFAVTRVSDGFYEDPYFDANWAGIRAAGLVRGVYQFFRPTRDAVGQADLLLRRMGPLLPGDLPPVLDVEVTDGASRAQMNAQIHAWVDRIQAATGRQPIIYVGSYFWDDNVGTTDFASLPLWLPAYGPVCPRLPNAWSHWRIHQYSSTGSIAGIGGNVDVDRFDGTLADLRALTGGSCPSHCEGTVMVGTDCGRGDCAASGAVCREDGGAHCVQLPRGALDAAECDAITGWAQDPNTADAPIAVDLYFDGPAGSGVVGQRVTAGEHRDDLCAAIHSCNHGFTLDTPARLRDGRAHTVYAYAINGSGGPDNPLLGGSPRTVRCAVAQLADFNGDGRSDVVAYRSDWQSVPVCLSLGSGWSCKNLPATQVDGWTGGNAGSGVLDGAIPLLGHFNDDRWADLIQFRADAATLPVCLSLVSGWSCRDLPAPYAGGDFPAGNAGAGLYPGALPLVGDFNGDGRSDVLQYNPTWESVPVCLSLASGWSCENLAAHASAGAGGGGNAGSGIFPGSTPLVGDFNGDGRADVIQYRADGTTLPVCLSLGSGWSCQNLPAVYAGGTVAGNAGSGVYAGSFPLVGDFNGDGRADVIQYRADGTTLPVCLSLGSGWSCQDLPAVYAGGDQPAGNGGGGVYAGGTALVGDFNGDGRADVVQYNPHWLSLPVCLSLGSGWSCRNLAATASGTDLPAGTMGSGIFPGGAPLVGDFNGDGRSDVIQYQSHGWAGIPVCLYTGSGWSCRNLRANYAGGLGPGNGGSGVY